MSHEHREIVPIEALADIAEDRAAGALVSAVRQATCDDCHLTQGEAVQAWHLFVQRMTKGPQ